MSILVLNKYYNFFYKISVGKKKKKKKKQKILQLLIIQGVQECSIPKNAKF